MKNKIKKIFRSNISRLAVLTVPALLIAYFISITGSHTGGGPILYVFAALLLYVLAVTLIFTIIDQRRISSGTIPDIAGNYTQDINALLYNSVSAPIVACDLHGVIRWGNSSFRKISDSAGTNTRKFSDIADIGIDSVKSTIDSGKRCLITVDGKNYSIDGLLLNETSDPLYITVWYDVTELENKKQELAENDTLIAYIYIDNLEELSQIEKDHLGSATADAEKILYDWAASVSGILISYERDKYIMLYKAKYLKLFIDNKFDILDKIREIRIGANYLPITISVGTSNVGATISEKRDNAYSALRFALAKGGDQAIVKTDRFSYYFGGITKTSQKRSSVKSQTIARALSAYICKSENVLIMGHRNPDFDSIGSCVGIARLCMHLSIPCNIIIDRNCPNIAKCFPILSSLSEYNDIFITPTQSFDLIGKNTLLIICDVNNRLQLEVPELVDRIGDIVYIDHHRMTEEFTTTPLLSYIEPSASSACELVSEIIEQVDDKLLRSQEANLMYAGIVLDTKHFVINTGVRTFESARYLRGTGDPAETYDMFRTDLNEMSRESRFVIDKSPYRDHIMIARNDMDDNVESDITLGAKIADRLLSVENIEASFVILRIGKSFRISARSSGDINVEAILRRLGGGGHFNAAGAQPEGYADIGSVVEALKSSIDKFLDEELNKVENN